MTKIENIGSVKILGTIEGCQDVFTSHDSKIEHIMRNGIYCEIDYIKITQGHLVIEVPMYQCIVTYLRGENDQAESEV